MHRWQSESSDGLKSDWGCVFLGVVTMTAVVTGLPLHPQPLDVAWRSIAVVVAALVQWGCSSGVV